MNYKIKKLEVLFEQLVEAFEMLTEAEKNEFTEQYEEFITNWE